MFWNKKRKSMHPTLKDKLEWLHNIKYPTQTKDGRELIIHDPHGKTWLRVAKEVPLDDIRPHMRCLILSIYWWFRHVLQDYSQEEISEQP